ncbi:hypothetical protein CPB84DRAFT_1775971 [Gymnopilus junonius]|uniref:Fungal-type protein kinase domain-containing protein n=1 Tax=Gymnopilus junonius TaxID=109634 RepID=A0A9P5NPT1_GYMJU|nr:hypothetical protein CPB84DRAFT_1775971 [Gymnopilus junonius]
MLSVEPPPEIGVEGFLLDLEFARFEHTSIHTTQIPPGHAEIMTAPAERLLTFFGPDIIRGTAITGTAQFMAMDILQGTISPRNAVQHEPVHDLESLVNALVYSPMRKAILMQPKEPRLHDSFHSHFGRMRLEDIWSSRLCFCFLRVVEKRLMKSRYPGDGDDNALPLCHEFVLSELDKAIASL